MSRWNQKESGRNQKKNQEESLFFMRKSKTNEAENQRISGKNPKISQRSKNSINFATSGSLLDSVQLKLMDV